MKKSLFLVLLLSWLIGVNDMFAQVSNLRVHNDSDYRVWARGHAVDPSCGTNVVSSWYPLFPAGCGVNVVYIPPVFGVTWEWLLAEVVWDDPSNYPSTTTWCPGIISGPFPNIDSWSIISSPYATCTSIYPSNIAVPVSCNVASGCGGSTGTNVQFVAPSAVYIN